MEVRPDAAADEVAAWAAHGRLGAAITTASITATALHILMTAGSPPALPVRVLLWSAPVLAALAFTAVPWGRIVAGGRGPRIFTAWSVLTITGVAVMGILDGGVHSPLLLWMFPALAFAAVGYRPGEVLGVGLYALLALGIVAVVSEDRVGIGTALTASILAVHIVNASLVASNSRGQRRRLARVSRQLRHLADHDALTGTGNRRALERQAAALLAGAPDTPHGLILIDVDHFKAVNDSLGHAGGDTALRAVADELRGEIRSIDHLARFGGEEFVVLAPGLDVEGAGRLAERLRRAVAASSSPARHLTISAGVSALTAAGGFEASMRAADDALYRAKGAGRDQVWTPAGRIDPYPRDRLTGRPTRSTAPSPWLGQQTPRREELVGGRPVRFWLDQARIAALLPGVTAIPCLAYAVGRDRPDGGALIAVVAVAGILVASMGLLPWERIIRRTGLAMFFVWSGLDLGSIVLMAALDGGAGSPWPSCSSPPPSSSGPPTVAATRCSSSEAERARSSRAPLRAATARRPSSRPWPSARSRRRRSPSPTASARGSPANRCWPSGSGPWPTRTGSPASSAAGRSSSTPSGCTAPPRSWSAWSISTTSSRSTTTTGTPRATMRS